MRTISLIALSFLAPLAATASDACRSGPAAALADLRSQKTDPDFRSAQGVCLVRSYLDLPEVAEAALKVIQDPREDLFLRQDLVEAFADARLRRQVRVKAPLAPEVKREDRELLHRTASTAGQLLALAEAVKSMDETVAVCPVENKFLRALSELAAADETPVILRSSAVGALEKAIGKIVASGVYEEKSLRFAQESLRNVASRDDTGSYFTGAGAAYARLADANTPYFAPGSEGRALASVRKKP